MRRHEIDTNAGQSRHYKSMATGTQTETAQLLKSANSQPLLSIRNIAKSFSRSPVLRDISLEIAEGEFLTILGESGSGKTTLLRILAGFENRPAPVEMTLNSRVWTSLYC